MDRPQSVQLKVGIFVAFCLILAMSIIVMLGGNRAFFTRYHKLRVAFPEVQGLFPGSVVSFGGIGIGNIETIDYSPEKAQIVIVMRIEWEKMEAIRQGTKAEIRTQGALGDKYIYLTPGPADAPGVQDLDFIEASTDGDLLAMLTSKDNGVSKALDLIKELNSLANALNQGGRPAVLMKNMTDSSENFKRASRELELLLTDIRSQVPPDKLRSAIVNLASVLEKLDKGQGSLGALINDPSVHQNLKTILGGSNRDRYLKDTLLESLPGKSK